MNRIDLIIDALSISQNSVWSKRNEQALAAARELKELYPQGAKVRPAEFVAAASIGVGVDFVGTPMMWAEWPTPESSTVKWSIPVNPNNFGEPLAQPEQEPVTHAVIAGVLFDFMGWLTSRPKRLVLSASDEASPAVKVIEEFAIMRGLSLDDAKVKDWQDMTAPPKQWVGLTDEEILFAAKEVPITCIRQRDYDLHFAPIIEAKLKEKNT